MFIGTACGNSREKSNSGIKQETSVSESALSDAEPEEAKKSEIGAVQTEVQPTESMQDSTEQEVTEMKIQVGDTIFTATLAGNSSVDALKELMEDGPLTLNMNDYAGMEKGADLGVTLPQNNEQMNTQAGDRKDKTNWVFLSRQCSPARSDIGGASGGGYCSAPD